MSVACYQPWADAVPLRRSAQLTRSYAAAAPYYRQPPLPAGVPRLSFARLGPFVNNAC
jgi:hypothetical protein